MMKTFENENHYEILQVSVNARVDEIKQAYRESLAMYDPESAATYALFSDQQRNTLLQAIETAFETLIDDDRRAGYDRMLIDTGQVGAAIFSSRARRTPAAYSDTPVTSKEESLDRWISKRAEEPEIRQLIETILSTDRLSGLSLKQLREAYGIEISEIYAITKISGDTLKRIETNQYDNLPSEIFLKQFLKTYADLFHIDSQHVVDSYLKLMIQDKPGH